MSRIKKEKLDVWFMRTPYSDYSENKARPAIIISNDNYNLEWLDFIAVLVTTRKEHPYAIKISNSDFSTGGLPEQSIVRFDTVSRYEENLLIRKIGKIKPEFYGKIYEKIVELIK